VQIDGLGLFGMGILCEHFDTCQAAQISVLTPSTSLAPAALLSPDEAPLKSRSHVRNIISPRLVLAIAILASQNYPV
jgi:hypothetical protein